MPLSTNRETFTFNHADQVDEYGAAEGDYTVVQSNFDSRAEQNLADINNIKTTLTSETADDSGAHNIKSAGIAGILSGAAASVYAMLSALKTYIDTIAAGFVLGEISDNTLTEAKMADEMKKDIASGVTAYDTFIAHESEKASDTVLGHIKVDGTTIIVDGGGIISLSDKKLSTDTTYYVNIARPDNTGDGLTQATAFKNIQYAIDELPKNLQANATIRVLAGDYSAEGQIHADGFYGGGGITLVAYTGTAEVTTLAESASYLIDAISANGCRVQYVIVKGFRATYSGTAYKGFEGYAIDNIQFLLCSDVVAQTGRVAFSIERGCGLVSSCQANNKSAALLVSFYSTVYSADWTAGSGNVVGISCRNASTVGKNGTQPQGTTAEQATLGGVIR